MEITFLYHSGLEYNLLLASIDSIIDVFVDIIAGFFTPTSYWEVIILCQPSVLKTSVFQALYIWGQAKKRGRAKEKTREDFLVLVLPPSYFSLYWARPQLPRAWNRLRGIWRHARRGRLLD